MKPFKFVLALVVIGWAGLQSASAQVTVYTDRAQFIAALTSYSTDTYDDLVFNNSATTPRPRANGSFPYTATSVGGFYAVGSPADVWLSVNDANQTITFSGFGSNVNAVGGYFFLTDTGAASVGAGSISLTATTTTGSSTQNFTDAGATNFVGFITTGSFTSLSFSDSSVNYVTANDLIVGIGSATPEPTSWAMMIGGFGILGGAVRKRRLCRLSRPTAASPI